MLVGCLCQLYPGIYNPAVCWIQTSVFYVLVSKPLCFFQMISKGNKKTLHFLMLNNKMSAVSGEHIWLEMEILLYFLQFFILFGLLDYIWNWCKSCLNKHKDMGWQDLASAHFSNKLFCFLCALEILKRQNKRVCSQAKKVPLYCFVELLSVLPLEFIYKTD